MLYLDLRKRGVEPDREDLGHAERLQRTLPVTHNWPQRPLRGQRANQDPGPSGGDPSTQVPVARPHLTHARQQTGQGGSQGTARPRPAWQHLYGRAGHALLPTGSLSQ